MIMIMMMKERKTRGRSIFIRELLRSGIPTLHSGSALSAKNIKVDANHITKATEEYTSRETREQKLPTRQGAFLRKKKQCKLHFCSLEVDVPASLTGDMTERLTFTEDALNIGN